ncbi:hypothetical protein Ao3042_00588 [Aspergillus oryzae 3.042]|uniref:Integral membrane protein n=1 Tax=Aspergillus oryzae (strain 3.042) TaxID=1160506 RepID=I8IS82_ASPO3|nr:hypothetical protein Ao3042_00588 [Aspergillus oryzae 3.042]|eukprot:EIT82276.1 hypothetical protein Ao3042_00588 [Aspergillus oryzae 3.042]
MTTRAAELLGVVVSFLVLALGTVALRCYVRIRIKRGFGLDDGGSNWMFWAFLDGINARGPPQRLEGSTENNRILRSSTHHWLYCNGMGLIKAAYVHSAITAFSDATLGLLPILIVRSLHLPCYIKIHVAVLLALGSV